MEIMQAVLLWHHAEAKTDPEFAAKLAASVAYAVDGPGVYRLSGLPEARILLRDGRAFVRTVEWGGGLAVWFVGELVAHVEEVTDGVVGVQDFL